MSPTLSQFHKQHNFLVCVDSDGCAMDTMTSKHEQAFCPCFINTYGFQAYAGLITPEWLRINLYSATRGINRFKGLAMILCFLHDNQIETAGREELCAWVESSPVLSEDALKSAIAAGGGIGLQKALTWSQAVNKTVANMGATGNSQPFPGCKKALESITLQADTAVVSAANSEAVQEEWTRCDLAGSMDLLLGQDAGSKAFCLKELVNKGYQPGHVLMCGDALGDLDAAKQAGALFFPILVGHESESWDRLLTESFPRLLNGTFAGEYQQTLIAEQKAILS